MIGTIVKAVMIVPMIECTIMEYFDKCRNHLTEAMLRKSRKNHAVARTQPWVKSREILCFN